jgi:hypothetical protein
VSEPGGRWSPYPSISRSSPERVSSGFEPVGNPGGQRERILGLGAICELRPPTPLGTSQSFSVAEFALLIDGTKVLLHDDRGFTIGAPSGQLRHVTAETIVQSVLNVVLPYDDESSDEHPWIWLASLAQARNLDVTSEELRHLPYEVLLSDKVRKWLSLTQDEGTGSY